MLVILCGWANLVSHTAILAPDDLRHLLAGQPALVTLCGVVAETPRLKIVDRKGGETEHTQTTIEATGLRRADRWESATGRVMIMTPAPLDSPFFPGQRVEVTGVIAPPEPPVAPGLLDYRAYLAGRGVYYQLDTRTTNDWRLAAGVLSRAPLTTRFLKWSRQTLARGLPAVDEPLRLIWAMALGWRTAFTGDLADPFLQAGTMHLFSINECTLRVCCVSC